MQRTILGLEGTLNTKKKEAEKRNAANVFVEKGLRKCATFFIPHHSTISSVELHLDLRGIKMDVCGICFVNVELCESNYVE